MKTSRIWALVLTLGWIMGLAAHLQAAPQYRYYTTGQGPGSKPVAINDNGQAVVNFNDHAFLWTLSGGLVDLGDLGGGRSYGFGINNLGQIVGESYIDSTTSHAFLWQSGNIQDLGGLSGGVRSIAISINNLSQVIGATVHSDNSFTTFRWTQAGGLQPLDLQGGIASIIKDDGRMVGKNNNHAWLWTAPGAGQDLGTLPAPYNGTSEARDINQNGQVVGWAYTPNPPDDTASRAFSWTQDGGLKDLGTLGGIYSRAFDITNEGVIVGWADTGSNTVGCLWTPSGDKLDLSALVINKPEGVTIGGCEGINAQGVILGSGIDYGAAFMLVPTKSFPGIFLLLVD